MDGEDVVLIFQIPGEGTTYLRPNLSFNKRIWLLMDIYQNASNDWLVLHMSEGDEEEKRQLLTTIAHVKQLYDKLKN